MTEQELFALTDTLHNEVQVTRALITQAVRESQAGLVDMDEVIFRHLVSVVLKAQDYFNSIEEQIEEVSHLARRMIIQQQSAKEAFAKGYEAGLIDLQAQLRRYDFNELLDAIHTINRRK